MLTIARNRALMARHLHGTGVEFGALDGPLELPDGARALYVDHLSTDELKAKYPDLNAVPVDIVIKGGDLDELEDGRADFIVANHVIEHLPNPIGALRTWGRKLGPFGTLYMSFPLREFCPDAPRPITPWKNLVSDDDRSVTGISDEHHLAFVWAWNPAYFPDPDNIELVLRALWAREDEYLTEADRALFTPANIEAVEALRAAADTSEIHHHVFDLASITNCVSHACLTADFVFSAYDASLTKGVLSENVIVYRKYPKAYMETAEGQRRLVEDARAYAAALARESAVEAFVFEQQTFIQDQRRILDDRYQMIMDLIAARDAAVS